LDTLIIVAKTDFNIMLKNTKPKPKIQIPIHGDFKFLFDHSRVWRYRVCPGGRGRGASWNYIRALLLIAYNPVKLWYGQKKVRILCTREIQRSIRESTWRLLKEQIEMCGLYPFFDVTDVSIKCKHNGSEFIFEGLLRNINKIKSYSSIDICDVEEGENISEESWIDLIPTIRNEYKDQPKINGEYPGSEIWVRYNPKYEDDATHQRFAVHAPDNAIVKFLSWKDNPDFPEVLKKEREQDYAYRPAIAKNIWEGQCLGTGRKVWPEFSEKLHVKQIDWDIIRDQGNCYMTMDPAMHYYPACLWIAVLPKIGIKGTFKYVYNEWPTLNDMGEEFYKARKDTLYAGTLNDMARAFSVKDGFVEHQLNIKARFIDTRFAKGTGSGSYFSGSTDGLVSEFAKRENGGLIFQCPNVKAIDSQRMLIIQDLQINTLQDVGPMNEPSLFVAPWCHNLITSLTNHRLIDGSEEEDPKYKDFSDSLRIGYAGLGGYIYRDPRPETPEITPSFVTAGYSGGSNGSTWAA
jgi:hypothetical protein